MSKKPLHYHPASWPWPTPKARDYPSQLARRARDLISRDGFFIRDVDDNIICQKTQVGDWHLTLWLRGRPRIAIVRDNTLALRFDSEGLQTMDGPLCKEAVRAITKAMVLQDLARL